MSFRLSFVLVTSVQFTVDINFSSSWILSRTLIAIILCSPSYSVQDSMHFPGPTDLSSRYSVCYSVLQYAFPRTNRPIEPLQCLSACIPTDQQHFPGPTDLSSRYGVLQHGVCMHLAYSVCLHIVLHLSFFLHNFSDVFEQHITLFYWWILRK